MAKKNAGVTCIIVGVRSKGEGPKFLITNNVKKSVKNIGPYLISMPNIIVNKRSSAISSMPEMVRGNMPYDGGNLILSYDEKMSLLAKYPQSESLVRRLYGSQEFVKGIERHCLFISDQDLQLAESIQPIFDRIGAVREARLLSSDASANKLAERPHQFREMRFARSHLLVVPAVTSENRPYLQIGFLDAQAVVNNRAYAIYDPEVYVFSVLSSRMHHRWTHAVAGKLEERINYGNTTVYNTFPIPTLSQTQKTSLEEHAWQIIEAREAHAGKTITWLYNPDTIPDNLLDAHRALDNTLEKIYIGRAFESDTERLEHLFKLYARMTEQKAAS